MPIRVHEQQLQQIEEHGRRLGHPEKRRRGTSDSCSDKPEAMRDKGDDDEHDRTGDGDGGDQDVEE